MRRMLRGAIAVLVTAGTLAAVPVTPAAAGTSQAVTIDLRPGASDNTVNLSGRAALPVAILTTSSFDATQVDPLSVCFGDAENATQRDCTEAHGTGHLEDVDADGDTDVLLHYDAEQAGLDAGDMAACLEGRTLGGSRFHGCDGVTVKNGAPEPELPDLTVDVVASPTSTGPAGVVTWAATLRNEGVGAITLAPGTRALRITAPTTLTATSVTAAAGFTCVAATATAYDCTNDDPETILAGGTRDFALTGMMPNVPGPVSVNATADPAGLVAESDETDNTRGATAVVEPGNLTTTLTATPAALAPGEPFQLVATVTNTGAFALHVPAGTRLLELTLPSGLAAGTINGPSGTSCSGTTCSTTVAKLLAVGDALTFTTSLSAPTTPAAYQAVAKADPADTLSESDEGDNRATADILVEPANLTSTVTTVQDPVGAAGPVEWTADLVNLGPGKIRIPAGTRAISFTFSEPLSGVTVTPPAGYTCTTVSTTEHTCATTALTTLLAGDRATFTVEGTAPASPGTVALTTKADPANAVAEADETDNEATSTATVVGGNLSISAAPAAAEVDALGSTTWNVTISNTAGAIDVPSGAHLLRFAWPEGFRNVAVAAPSGYSCFIVETNTADCATTAATTIAGGATIAFRVFGTAPNTPGPLTLTFEVDPLGVLTETDETDNATIATSIVRAPDLSTTLTVTPDPAEAGFSTTWLARVTNDGPANARISTGVVFVRFAVPSGMTNLAVATPAGFTCFLSGTLVADCQTTATLNIAAGSFLEISFFGTAPRDPGTIAMTVTADPLDVVPEVDETDNAATESVLVRGPDLTTTVSATPNPANAAHTVTFATQITNAGPSRARVPTGTVLARWAIPAGLINLAVSTPSGFTCFISATNVVDCQTTASLTVNVGQTLDLTLFGTAPRALSDITLTATADPLGGVPEEDETNNAASVTVPVQGPNLVATSLTPSLDPANAGHTVQWTGRITNDGPAPLRMSTGTTAFRFDVPPGLINLAVSTPSGFTCYIESTNVVHCDTTSLQTLAVGSFWDVTMFGTAPRALAPITMTLTADPLGAIPEANESDNSASSTVDVQGPDFSITMGVTPNPANAAHTVTWSARITNDGPAPVRVSTGFTPIRFQLPAGLINLAVSTPTGFTCFIAETNVVECDATSLQTLAVGSFWDITLFGTAPRALGPISVTATADSDGTIPEEDETDNTVTTTVDVQGPDFSVTLTPSADTVDAAHSIQWTAAVTNDGPAPARIPTGTTVVRFDVPPGLINLAVSTPTGYTCFIASTNVVECETTTLQTIAVGATHTITFFGTAPRNPGPITLTVTADSNGTIPEEDEGDNTASSTVTVQPPDLTMAVTADTPTVTAGSPAAWTVELGNAGPARARLSSTFVGVQIIVPADLAGPAVSAPGWTCTAVDATTFECRPDTTTTIPVGGAVAFAVTGTATQPGTFTVSGTADPRSTLPEVLESNNAASGVVTAT